jgi:hypothetical protein
MTSVLVNERAKKLEGLATCKRYPSDSDKLIRLKRDVYFSLDRVVDYWAPHRDFNFSKSDAVSLLLKFYEQFYPSHKEDFEK